VYLDTIDIFVLKASFEQLWLLWWTNLCRLYHSQVYRFFGSLDLAQTCARHPRLSLRPNRIESIRF
jgi:hypothetical protein